MDTTLSSDEVYTICNALNAQANNLERDAKRDRAKGFTFGQIAVVEHEVKTLRELSQRLIDEKNA
jgi:hypothetical protein